MHMCICVGSDGAKGDPGPVGKDGPPGEDGESLMWGIHPFTQHRLSMSSLLYLNYNDVKLPNYVCVLVSEAL